MVCCPEGWVPPDWLRRRGGLRAAEALQRPCGRQPQRPLPGPAGGAAAQHADGRVVSVLEGGYNTVVLAHCVAAHLEELLAGQDEERP